MKRPDLDRVNREKERLFEWALGPLKVKAKRVNNAFGSWCLAMPPKKLKRIFLLIGAAAVAGNITVLTFTLHTGPAANFGQISRPDHVVFRQGAAEFSPTFPTRPKNEFKRLVDSLRQDSAGRIILDHLKASGVVKLDSALLGQP